jgi:Zn2+/Cd2+-exporting ATPase
MGGVGSAQALETADIALSVGVKVAFVLLALLSLTSMWLAILADVGMLLIVTLNGMRPVRFE